LLFKKIDDDVRFSSVLGDEINNSKLLSVKQESN